VKVEFEGKEYYTITDLANAIGVTSRTIKVWEKAKCLPPAYRHPVRDWRLYTQEEIEELVQLAKKRNYFRDYTREAGSG